MQQPIIAIATASGNAGLGVVRLSGKNLESVIQAICGQVLKPRYAHYLAFLDSELDEGDADKIIDQGIALYFPAPHSYTGECVLELQAHGGSILLQRLVKACLKAGQSIGLRLAEPGEFTQRAFLNQKIDLLQAEAISDVIHASSEEALKRANQSMRGEFSKTVHILLEQLIHLRLLVEAVLDFPEEEIDFIKDYQISTHLNHLLNAVNTTLTQAKQGLILQKGACIALVGEPNVGKSSLLNALSGEEVAIVTPIAGTTRDKIQVQINVQGIVLNVIDTAGLRDTQDIVEQMGIERTWQAIKDADIILHVQDNLETSPFLETVIKYAPNAKLINVFNKIDSLDHAALRTAQQNLNANYVFISAKHHQGLQDLADAILTALNYQPNQDTVFLARERHILALQSCQFHLQQAHIQLQASNIYLDMIAEDLRLAQQYLNELTGEFTSDDLLGKIFSSFCIGK